MAGIYIHIPFCKQACHYCNFHFSTSQKNIQLVVNAIEKEIGFNRNYLEGEPIETIYFGGGTPSILNEIQLEQIIKSIRNNFNALDVKEITLEANPDDLTMDKMQQWLKAGINRLSIGTQSFFDKDLVWINRAHSAAQAIQSISNAQQCGLPNISIDLIYGLPESTDDEWKQNLETAFNSGAQHLSCYSLTVEPKTALENFIRTGKSKPIDEEKSARQFEVLMNLAPQFGFEHYEISNFAKSGMRSKHNSSYWSGKKYLGVGPSAHSYNGVSRQWNIANNNLYVSQIEKGIVPAETEILTLVQQYNEFVMIRLRTVEGISFNEMKEIFPDFISHFQKEIAPFVNGNLIQQTGSNLSLTNNGRLLADHIISELMIVED